MKRFFPTPFFFASYLIITIQAALAQELPTIIGLYPTGESQPESANSTILVFEYKSDLITPISNPIQINYSSLKLRDWTETWSIVTPNNKGIALQNDPLIEINQPFFLRCQLKYSDNSQKPHSFPSQSPVPNQHQQEAIRPEVLLVFARNVSVPCKVPEPSFIKRLLGAKAPRRVDRSQEISPNVIILLIDTLRLDHTPPGGHPFILAPHIDMLSSLGVFFSESYGASSSTRPSVGSILTGLQPNAHGAVRHATDGSALYVGVPFLPEKFLQSGYRTAAVSSNAQISPAFGFDRGFETFNSSVWESQVTPKGIEHLRKLDEPFFLYLHYMGPHQPYEPASPWKGLYKGQTTIPNTLPSAKTVASASHALHDAYAEEITQEDHQIGLILKELCQQGLLDRTILWLVSDHGEEFWEHGWNGHGATVFEESVQTLSILFYPALLSTRKTISIPIMQVDMVPTLSELLNWKSPTLSQGKSLVPLIKNSISTDFVHRPVFLHHGGGDSALPHISDKEAVLLDRKKLIVWPEINKWELYDIENDPFEQNNLFQENDPNVQRLKPLLENHLETCKTIEKAVQTFSDKTLPPLSAQEIENLEAHGYNAGKN